MTPLFILCCAKPGVVSGPQRQHQTCITNKHRWLTTQIDWFLPYCRRNLGQAHDLLRLPQDLGSISGVHGLAAAGHCVRDGGLQLLRPRLQAGNLVRTAPGEVGGGGHHRRGSLNQAVGSLNQAVGGLNQAVGGLNPVVCPRNCAHH